MGYCTFLIIVTLLLFVPLSFATPNYRPVVLMHGLMAGAEAMSHAQGWIEADFPGIYIHNVEIGDGRNDSLRMDINLQVQLFAQSVQNDTNLKGGFNLIGHSQGGLITRAYVERYNNPPVYNLISWAGPQDGVYGVPDVNSFCPDEFCPILNWLFDLLMGVDAPSQYIQEHYTFASYWKNIYHYEDYQKNNIFLADINNEKVMTNSTYKKNIMSLNTYVLVYSTNDTIVIPKESPWFYFFPTGSDRTVVPFNQTEQYTDDLIGLGTLYDQGKIAYYHVPCGHEDIPRAGCGQQYYEINTRPYLNNTL